MFKLSHRSKRRRIGVDLRLIEINDLALQISVIDFGIPEHGGLRDAEEQNQLYSNGFSKADGYINLSLHQPDENGFSRSLDFYAYVNGAASWQSHHLAMVAAAHLQAASMLGYAIEWGGFWKRKTPKFKNGIPYGWDMAHIQLAEEN